MSENGGRRYVFWGSAGHAKVVAGLVAAHGGRVVALFDNRDVESALLGVPVFVGEAGFQAWASSGERLDDFYALVTIGGAHGRERLAIQERLAARGLRIEPLLHPTAVVAASARLGAGTQVLAQAIVAADARVGAACIINHRASVDHECVLGDGVHVAPAATLCGLVSVGDGALIGAGAVVLPRLVIGADAVVGAGAVVTRDVPAGAIVIGPAARALRPGR